MAIKEDITWRTAIVYIVIVACGVAVLLRAFYVMTVEREKWTEEAKHNSPVKPMKIAPSRGDICADDGRVLATSVPYYELRFDPVAVNGKLFKEKVDSLALCLSRFFNDASPAYYRSKLIGARNRKPRADRYLLINSRRVNHAELKVIRKFPIFRLGKNRGGFQAIVNNRRLQPHVNLASRTIGYMNEADDRTFEGRVGLEAAFENQLRGIPGEGYKRMMSGTWIVVKEKEPVDGMDVVTTIDVDYQDIVQQALRNQLEKYEADQGTAVLMEVKTGDIKAIANLSRRSDGSYGEDVNIAIGDAGEPGSVIKAATMIALLEDGSVSASDTIDLGKTGTYRFYGTPLSESSHRGLGKVTVKQIMEKSSNGIACLVYEHFKNRPKKYVDRLYAMGLDKKVGVCIPGEGQPYIKYPTDKDWSGITLPWMSIGYELELTPLQVLAFYNAIANDGQRMKPRLVKEVRRRGQVVETFDPEEVGGRICSRRTLEQLKDMLEGVVENGTAKNIYTSKYRIAGKTGTARIADNSRGYGVRKYRASFVGFFPADRPLYSCIVVIDNPSLSKGYYANVVSAAAFREISDQVYSMAYLKYGTSGYTPDPSLPVCKNGLKDDFVRIFDELDMGVEEKEEAEDSEWVVTASDEAKEIVLKPRKISYMSVPNVKGMGLRDALYVLENSGLKVGSTGAGMVCAQSLLPGTRVAKGSYIQIELR